jgi:hypothetical protein
MNQGRRQPGVLSFFILHPSAFSLFFGGLVMFRSALVLFSLVLLAVPSRAESLPVVDDVEWNAFRASCQRLLDALPKLDSPLPSETIKAVQALLDKKRPSDPRAAARAVQKLLDAHCLVGVNINPESRVKAVRGPRKAELTRDRAIHVLVKVHNDGGVTHALAVASPQKIQPGKKGSDRWLELAVVDKKPFAKRLSGSKVEYRVLELTARQTGKREATLAFDVGQGTQDLGFRAEVPILFTVRPR